MTKSNSSGPRYRGLAAAHVRASQAPLATLTDTQQLNKLYQQLIKDEDEDEKEKEKEKKNQSKIDYLKQHMDVLKSIIKLRSEQLQQHGDWFILNANLESHFAEQFLIDSHNWIPIFDVGHHLEKNLQVTTTIWTDGGVEHGNVFGDQYSTDFRAQLIDECGQICPLPQIITGSSFQRQSAPMDITRARASSDQNDKNLLEILLDPAYLNSRRAKEFTISESLLTPEERKRSHKLALETQIIMIACPAQNGGLHYFDQRKMYYRGQAEAVLEIILGTQNIHVFLHDPGKTIKLGPLGTTKADGALELKAYKVTQARDPAPEKTLMERTLEELPKTPQFKAYEKEYKKIKAEDSHTDIFVQFLKDAKLNHLVEGYLSGLIRKTTSFHLFDGNGRPAQSDMIYSLLVPVTKDATGCYRRNNKDEIRLCLAPHIVLTRNPEDIKRYMNDMKGYPKIQKDLREIHQALQLLKSTPTASNHEEMVKLIKKIKKLNQSIKDIQSRLEKITKEHQAEKESFANQLNVAYENVEKRLQYPMSSFAEGNPAEILIRRARDNKLSTQPKETLKHILALAPWCHKNPLEAFNILNTNKDEKLIEKLIQFCVSRPIPASTEGGEKNPNQKFLLNEAIKVLQVSAFKEKFFKHVNIGDPVSKSIPDQLKQRMEPINTKPQTYKKGPAQERKPVDQQWKQPKYVHQGLFPKPHLSQKDKNLEATDVICGCRQS